MITSGQATFLRSNINSFIALVFVGAVALGAGLMVWKAATGINPVEKAMASQLYDLN